MRKIRRRFVRISAGMIGLRWNQLTRQSWFRRIVICVLAYFPCTHSFSCKASNRDNNTLLANSVISAFLTDYNSANIYRQPTNDSPRFLLLHSLPTMRSKLVCDYSFKNKYVGLEKITAVFHFKYLEFYQYHREAIESFKEFTIFYYFGFGRHPFWSMSRLLR